MFLFLQDQPAQSACKACPEGYYCNATTGPVVWYGSYVCPEGSYCPEGTRYPDEYPCPIGTYNNYTGMILVIGMGPMSALRALIVPREQDILMSILVLKEHITITQV